MTFRSVFAASSGAAGLFQQLLDNIWIVLIVLCLGVLIGLIGGVIYSRYKAKYFSNEAERRIKNIISDFKKEKDTSETILRELQVGVLAYGADGRLITGNPSANTLLGIRDMPQTMQGFLNRYGKDNGISLALMLQTNNVTGNVAVKDRIVRLRITRAQLSMYRTPSWIVILQDITEQEREDKQRKEFVANVSHELKTPLTTISAYSETLLDWGLEGKTIQEIRSDIARIHDDSNRMDHLVQNLLLLSSIDSRGIRPNMIQYDIVSLMRQVVSRMQIQAKEKSIELKSSVLSIVPPIFGDPTAMDRILTNLISNAIKYTDHSGHVMVSLQKTDNYISLKVADNGMGVAKDNIPRLFDRFYRVDSTGSRKYGGTGLGLSIAKELTELQGGTISVSSILGKGSEFVVTIPKAETTYRETLAAILSDSPRTEIIFENARQYLTKAAEDIDLPVYELSKITGEQIEELLSYLLMVSEEEVDTVNVRSMSVNPPRNAPAPEVLERPRNAPAPEVPERPRNAPAPEVPERPRNAPAPAEKLASAPVTTEMIRSNPGSDALEKPRSSPVSQMPVKSGGVPAPEPMVRPSYMIEPSPVLRNSDRVAKTMPGKAKTSAQEAPIKRNMDVVSPGPIKAMNTNSTKELSDRLTKSKIHPDNRQHLRLSDLQSGIDSLHPRESVEIDINTKEDKREN
jgi:two-component system sensor histidine kinase VicK